MKVHSGSAGVLPPRTHCRYEWEQIKPVLIEIYCRPGLRLEDVRQIMATQYGFSASPMMYKKRLHGWGVRKNLKAVDKEIIINQAQLESQTQHIRRKVLRYAKEKQRQLSSWSWQGTVSNTYPSASETSLSRDQSLSSETSEDSDCQHQVTNSDALRAAPILQSSTNAPTGESFLELAVSDPITGRALLALSIRQCVLSFQSGHSHCPFSKTGVSGVVRPTVFWRDPPLQEMYFSFYLGKEALSLGLSSNATSHFNTACGYLEKSLEQLTQQLLIDLFDLIRVMSYGQNKAHTLATYRFLATTIRRKLGPQHALTVAVCLAVRHANDMEWLRSIWVSLASAGDGRGATDCDCIRSQARSHQALALECFKRLEEAIDINQEVLETEVATLGFSHEATRRTMFRLGRLHCRKGNTDTGIQSLESTLQMIRSQPALSSDHTIHLLIYSELGRAQDCLGNYRAAMNWYWCAFHESSSVFGGRYEDTIWHLQEFVAFIHRHDNVDEIKCVLEHIKQHYSESYDLMMQGLEGLRLQDQGLTTKCGLLMQYSLRSVLSTRAMPSRCQQVLLVT